VQPDLTVLADRDLLVRALSNILRNAIRYAGAAGPIEISSEERKDIGIIRVSDCGPGMADKLRCSNLSTAESARTRETGGVGLGLAIVKTCVEACRGTVCCRNKSPKGLEVEIEVCSAHTGHTPRSSSA
jgi:two-component system, OmpR family, sensor histidine kinase CpxA